MVISDARLQHLAKARGLTVFHFLRDTAKVDPARLLVTTSAGAAITTSSSGPGNRVEFTFVPLLGKEGRP